MAVRSESLNIISLCTGGGGLDLGVELAMPGARSVCLVEREAFAASHLVAAMQQGLLDEAPVWSDVTTFDGRPWRGLVDGLIGGIPCQPHSLAGKRLGEDDERDLWSAARRIIVQARPHDGEIVKFDDDQREVVLRKTTPMGAARLAPYDINATSAAIQLTHYTRRKLKIGPEAEIEFLVDARDSSEDALRFALEP